jgi:hypothetical protein
MSEDAKIRGLIWIDRSALTQALIDLREAAPRAESGAELPPAVPAISDFFEGPTTMRRDSFSSRTANAVNWPSITPNPSGYPEFIQGGAMHPKGEPQFGAFNAFRYQWNEFVGSWTNPGGGGLDAFAKVSPAMHRWCRRNELPERGDWRAGRLRDDAFRNACTAYGEAVIAALDAYTEKRNNAPGIGGKYDLPNAHWIPFNFGPRFVSGWDYENIFGRVMSDQAEEDWSEFRTAANDWASAMNALRHPAVVGGALAAIADAIRPFGVGSQEAWRGP